MINDAMCRTRRPADAGADRSAQFPSISRPHGVLTLKEFAFIQRREAGATLHSMVYECWRAYRDALTLTRPGEPLPDAFAKRADRDVGPLLLVWDRVCVWYREHLFDQQLNLFTCPHETELTRWHRWVDRRVINVILDQPLWVRMVLETLGYLPRHTLTDDSVDLESRTVAACFETIIQANMEAYHAC